MHRKIILLFFLIGSTVLQAQQLNHVLGDIIVQLSPKVEQPTALVQQYKRFKGKSTAFATKKCLNEDSNIWLLHFDFTNINEYHLLSELRNNKLVHIAQFNHLIEKRKIPNDPLFNFQWNLLNSGENGGTADADIDVDLAWDITTGGLTPEGDTIVIAVIDDGVDLDHPDLSTNLWKNYKEIPNNGIDDDNNGYVDDYDGWNVNTDSDNVDNTRQTAVSHGTEVAGFIGALGNNDLGITGINWSIKLMIISPFGIGMDSEATAIEAYSYVLTMRKAYNESNGQKGAYVVATNSSWGFDGLMEADAPIFCDFYNTLGEEGIINTVATVNIDINIDVEGDLPTTCTSDYLIGVTNSTNRDEKAVAGYGPISVDLAAPAENVAILLQDGNTRTNGSGTSYAAPQVAGVVGLLYAAPCNNFTQLSKRNPNAAARLIKEYILNGVDVNSNFSGLTVTSGRLNANNSLQLLMADCGACPTPIGIELNPSTSSTLKVDWLIENTVDITLRYRIVGQDSWTTISNLQAPYNLDNLSSCTDYEIQLASQCVGESLDYTASLLQTTEGCCIPPSNIESIAITTSSITTSWSPVIDSDTYEMQWQREGTSIWESAIVEDTTYTITDQTACTNYLVRVRPICTNRTTTFSDNFSFKTRGCGACTEAAYCQSFGKDASLEWISNISINDLNNPSQSNVGYGDFTDISTTLKTYETYDIAIDLGYSSSVYEEFFRVWIDFNQDGQFDENAELVYNSTTIYRTEGQITIPGNAITGSTRMRVSVKSSQANTNLFTTPCEIFDFGEVEDYCVNIIAGSFNCTPPLISSSTSTNTNIQLNLMDIESATSYKVRYKPMGSSIWQEQLFDLGTPIELNNLTTCITYDMQVATVCADGSTSSFSTLTNIATACDCGAPTNLTVTPLDSTGFVLEWTGIGTSYEVFLGTPEQFVILETINDNFLVVNNLQPCTYFDLNITAFCQAERGSTLEEKISSPCPTNIAALPLEINALQVAPNPFKDVLNLQLDLKEATTLQLSLHHINGQIIKQYNIGLVSPGLQNQSLNIPELAGGIYLLKITTASGIALRKIVRME